MSTFLVTGGAGFIGSHLSAALLARGCRVRVLDAFVEQVHGQGSPLLAGEVEIVRGDVRDRRTVDAALDDVEVVFHQAAEVGVGQSMYDIDRYVATNSAGTAVLLEAILARRHAIRKLVVASSMSIYGEGAYECPRCGIVAPEPRPRAQLARGEWEPICPACRHTLTPRPTPETNPLRPTSVYAVTKQDQEQLCLLIGRAYGIPAVALRYFNVYGPGQALSNPYTGVAAIFCGRLLNGQPALVFEDGRQSRDFVHVSDIVRANLLALDSHAADYTAVNVGTGTATSVARVAELLAAGLGVAIPPVVPGRYREGDIRHCVADISTAGRLLGFTPRVTVDEGLPALAEWTRGQRALNPLEEATGALEARGLLGGPRPPIGGHEGGR